MAKEKTAKEEGTPPVTEQPPVAPPVATPDETPAEGEQPEITPVEEKGPAYYWVGVRGNSRYRVIQSAGLNWGVQKQLVSATAIYLPELKANEYLEVTPAEE